MQKSALVYALISTLFLYMVIPVVLLVIKPNVLHDLGYLLRTPIFVLPMISAFITGYLCFSQKKLSAWLLGLLHFITAHLLAFVLFFVYIFNNFSQYSLKDQFAATLGKTADFSLLSLIIGIWILPFLMALAYYLRKKLSLQS